MSGRRPMPAAFTLVELVLAVGITAVLAALLLGIVTNTLGIWQRSAATMTTENAGAVVLDRISQDLSAWTCRAAGLRWSQSGGESDTPIELRFVCATATTSRDDQDVSAERLVVYHWNPSTMVLYRWESTAVASLESGYELDGAAVQTGPEWILGEGIQGFTVRWFDASGNEVTGEAGAAAPVRVEVELTLMSESGRARLAAVANGNSTEPTTQIIAETTRPLTRWVSLSTGGPF